jgi:Holliday junction resolvase RusA-like endonuclease
VASRGLAGSGLVGRGMGFTVTIPKPPSVNSLYRVVARSARDGRRFSAIAKTPEGVRFHEDAFWIIRACPKNGWRAPDEGYIRIKLKAYLVRDIDADNLLKATSDALQAGIGVDDRRFLWCIVRKVVGVRKADARLELEILDDPEHC